MLSSSGAPGSAAHEYKVYAAAARPTSDDEDRAGASGL